MEAGWRKLPDKRLSSVLAALNAARSAEHWTCVEPDQPNQWKCSMIKQASIISIPVADQPSAKRFYTEVLGFRLLRDNPMGPDRQWVQVGLPGADLLHPRHLFDSMAPGSLAGIVLETDDIESEHAALTARGLALSPIEEQPWGGGRKFATFEDPDGNGFVLQQSSPDA